MSNNSLSKEEWANVYTHGVAIPFCLLGSILLLLKTGPHINTSVYNGLLVFCCSLIFTYTISTLYHRQTNPRIKHLFRVLDHIAIYLLIAGTHTPFLLLFLPTTYGISFLVILWLIAFLGTIYKIFFVGRYEGFSIFLYIAMGWSAVLTLPYMWQQFPENVLLWIVIGGLSYTVGGVFYAKNNMPYNHAFWHLFVIGGSLGHFWALWLCLQ